MTTFKPAGLVLSAALMTGCGSAPALLSSAPQETRLSPRAVAFQTVTLQDLSAWDKPANAGKRIAFTATFQAERYLPAYMVTHEGYRLCDTSGHAIRVQNIYTAIGPTERNASRDFSTRAIDELVKRRKPVKVAGAYQPSTYISSHGAAVMLPASLVVERIDGLPVREYLAR